MSDKEKFIADLYPAAKKISQETGMSWELILAQAAQETGWGQHQLQGTNNIFNIKAGGGWDGPTKTFNVWEIEDGKKVWKDQPFRVYSSVEEALRDRVEFLRENPRYAKAGLFDEGVKGNFEKEAAALQKAGYATDPNYAQSLENVFNGPTMQRAIRTAQTQEQSSGQQTAPMTNQTSVASSTAAATDGTFKKDGVAVDFKSTEALKIVEQAPLLSNPNHPNHALYQQALAGIEKLPPNSFRNDQERQNAAAMLASEAKAGDIKHIDQVLLSTNGAGLFAVQDPDKEYRSRVYVDKAQAVLQPIEQSTAQLDQERQVQQQTQAQQQQRQVAM